jgi:hypothetical protein
MLFEKRFVQEQTRLYEHNDVAKPTHTHTHTHTQTEVMAWPTDDRQNHSATVRCLFISCAQKSIFIVQKTVWGRESITYNSTGHTKIENL